MKRAKQIKQRNAAAMGKQWGTKCAEYFPGCAQCEAWKVYAGTGRVPTFDNARIVAAQAAA